MSSIKLTADSGGGTFEIKAPSSSGNTRVLTLPDTGNITLPDTNGITEADIFRLTADVSVSGTTEISTNFERPDTANDGFGKLGSGMSFSGAVWTFPSTGIYHILFNGMLYGNGGGGTTQFQIMGTEDGGSNYGMQSSAHASVTNGTFASVCPTALIDVTNTSNVKVKFQCNTSDSNQLVGSNSGVSLTYFTFIRLGDT